jgi:hypothetical protein
MSLKEKNNKQSSNATPIALDILMKLKGQMRFKSGYRYLHVTGAFTYEAARDCCCLKKSLVTASYVSEEAMELDVAVRKTICFHERDRIDH